MLIKVFTLVYVVSTLKAIRRQLNDPFKRLNWTRGDPCTSHWTGVICISDQNDGYLHVQELYVCSFRQSINKYIQIKQTDL